MNEKYHDFRHEIQSQQHALHQDSSQHHINLEEAEDLNMDAKVKDVSLERANSSLQLSLAHKSKSTQCEAVPVAVHTSKPTPPTIQYRNPQVGDASINQNEKKRESVDYSTTSKLGHHTTNISQKKVETLSIDTIGQMWLKFQMHEAFAIQKETHLERKKDGLEVLYNW